MFDRANYCKAKRERGEVFTTNAREGFWSKREKNCKERCTHCHKERETQVDKYAGGLVVLGVGEGNQFNMQTGGILQGRLVRPHWAVFPPGYPQNLRNFIFKSGEFLSLSPVFCPVNKNNNENKRK